MSGPGGGAGPRARRWLAPAVALLVGVALLVPTPDRATLVAQGVARLLARDLDRARAAPPHEPSLFGTLAAMAAGGGVESVSLRVRLDGAPGGAPLERAAAVAFNRFEHQSGLGLRRVAAGADLDVSLDARIAGGRLTLEAALEGAGRHAQLELPEHWTLPGRGALVPPLLAVAVALALRGPLLALFAGIWAGSTLVAAREGALALAPLRGLWDVAAVYLHHELTDSFRFEILGFVVALVGMVGVMSRAGGVRGFVERLLGFASTARSALLLTWALGLAIFFDDYANCVLVGSTMRPLTDRLRVSREKLAWVVDSTAAPVAGLSLLSTWIAFEVSVYSAQLPELGLAGSGYALFVRTLPYRFYCWLTLWFVFASVASGRDFGPMWRAEQRARTTGRLVREGGRPPLSEEIAHIAPQAGMPLDWRLAVVPLAVTLVATLWGVFSGGGGPALLLHDPGALLTAHGVLGVLLRGSGSTALLGGAVAGFLCAAFLAGSSRARLAIALGTALAWAVGAELGLPAASMTAYAAEAGLFALGAAAGSAAGARWRTRRPHLSARALGGAAAASAGTLGFAVVLLFEAWMIGAVCGDVGTADYLVALLSGALPPGLLPLLLFVASCAVSFATGSSWSTMSILLPNAVPLAGSLGAGTPLGVEGMVVLCISAVFEGSIFGDHCSPISDTTVLSSVSSGSDHLDHVRTQLPYALVVAGAALLCGYVPILVLPGWSPVAGLAAGAALLAALLLALGRRAAGGTGPASC